ncbi:MAG: AraC family transcriptional regulator [Bacilli bacterium]|nr:AraC family transcriptional regulator [Bacilli bacterium]
MKVRDLLIDDSFRLTVEGNLDAEITGCYCGDLLSWVMSHIKPHQVWCTVLSHVNIVAVASLTQVSSIIICEDAPLEEATLNKAKQESINIIATSLTSAEVARRILNG